MSASAEDILKKYFPFNKKEDLWVGEILAAMEEYLGSNTKPTNILPATNGPLSKDDIFLINGSGLFFFDSRLSDEMKLKIVNWYCNLSATDKEFVDILRTEAIDEADYFANGD